MRNRSAERHDSAIFWFFIGLIVLLVVRIVAICLTELNLGPDEAQYWRWGQSFDWGYFSKPPFVAWTIGAVTSILGDAPWAVRLPSPLFHTGTAVMLFLAGRQVWSARVGVYAGLSYAVMGGVWLSSLLMTTDVALLFFWSASLFLLFRLRDKGGLLTAALLGLTIGLGFLSKYAMIYFLIGLAFMLLVDGTSRKRLLGVNGLIATAVSAALLIPHILWNSQNGFKTVSHTADNANWGASLFNPENALKFFGDQFGVFGPVHMALLLLFIALFLMRARGHTGSDPLVLALLGFILPPLVIILIQAFISRAHANWAASAYPAACLLLGWWAAQRDGWVRNTLMAGFAANIIIGGTFTLFAVLPHDTQVALGGARSVKRLTAWPETVSEVNRLIAAHGASAVIVDEREIWHGLDYYGRNGVIAVPVRAWRRQDHPKSASEEAPITNTDARSALVLSYRVRDRDKLLADFNESKEIGELVIPLGGKYTRTFRLFLVSGFDPETNKAKPPAS